MSADSVCRKGCFRFMWNEVVVLDDIYLNRAAEKYPEGILNTTTQGLKRIR